MSFVMGIDIGSTSTKAVLADKKTVIGFEKIPSGNCYANTAEQIRDVLLKNTGVSDDRLICVISTGQAAGLITFSDQHLDALQCCAMGTHYLLPSVRTVFDMQCQTIQIVLLDDNGRIRDLAISDKCAGGSGVFVDIIANVLQVNLEEVGPISMKSKKPVIFSTGCAVFGESEAVSRIAEGIPKEDILAGAHIVLTRMMKLLAKRLDVQPPCAITGGCGKNIGLVKSLVDAGFDIQVPPNPEFTNAIGAALIAGEIIT